MLKGDSLKSFKIKDIEEFHDWDIQANKLKYLKNTDQRCNSTLGYFGTFSDIEHFDVYDKHGTLIKSFDSQEDCFNIYREKFEYFRKRTFILPDLKFLFRIINTYFVNMSKLKLNLDNVPHLITFNDLMDYLSSNYYRVQNDFNWKKNNTYSMSLDNGIQLFVTNKKELKLGFSIRLPTRSKHVLKLYVIPNDKNYNYYVRVNDKRLKGSCVYLETEEEINDFLKDIIFKSSYYYKPMLDMYGTFNFEDVNDETFEVMQMFKFE